MTPSQPHKALSLLWMAARNFALACGTRARPPLDLRPCPTAPAPAAAIHGRRELPSALWSLAVAVALAGCSGAAAKMPASGPQTPADLLAALRPPKVETLQGTARLEAYVGAERRSVTLLILAKRPQSLQFQALAPTLDMLALLSTDGSRFLSYERGGEQCLTGGACPHNLARILPLPLPAPQLVAALLGELAPLEVPPDQRVLAWDAERKLYRLELGSSKGLLQHYFVDPQTLAPAGAVWYQNGKRLTSLQYDGDRVAGGLQKWLKVKSVQPAVEMTVEFREIEANLPLGDEAFAATCPEGMRQIELPCDPSATR